MEHISTDELLSRIQCASTEESGPILDIVAKRFSQVWPEWELLTLSIHGHDPASHVEALQKSIDLLQCQT